MVNFWILMILILKDHLRYSFNDFHLTIYRFFSMVTT